MARALIILSILLVSCCLIQSAPSGDVTEDPVVEETTAMKEDVVVPPVHVLKSSAGSFADPNDATTSKGSLGDTCDSDENCKTSNSSCQGDVCSCDAHFTPDTNQTLCYPVAHRLGDACEINSQCSSGLNPLTYGRTKCLDMRCVCAPGLHESDGKCIGKQKLGGRCEIDQECTIQHSKCLQSVCACPSAYLPNAENDQCVAKAGAYNDSCTMDEQCEDLGDAICKASKCVCKAMMILVDGKCAMMKELGSPCASGNECQTNLPSDSRDCINNTCSCSRGYTQKEDICVKSGSSTIRMSVFTLVTALMLKYFV